MYYITHPDVVVDPQTPVPRWPLSERGRARMRVLLQKDWVSGIDTIYCSTEQKAIDGAEILSNHLGMGYSMVEELGENDRSSTGFLPGDEFEATADQFFANPDTSVRGWETATAAQRRITRAVKGIVDGLSQASAIAIVAHGGVGTLLLCHLKGEPISRSQDQPGRGGGNYFAFDARSYELLYGWKPIDE